jgi:hypothetical protein
MTRERATSAYSATKDEHVPAPIVLVAQDGHWKITHDTAMPELPEFWLNGSRPSWVCRRYLT